MIKNKMWKKDIKHVDNILICYSAHPLKIYISTCFTSVKLSYTMLNYHKNLHNVYMRFLLNYHLQNYNIMLKKKIKNGIILFINVYKLFYFTRDN